MGSLSWKEILTVIGEGVTWGLVLVLMFLFCVIVGG